MLHLSIIHYLVLFLSQNDQCFLYLEYLMSHCVVIPIRQYQPDSIVCIVVIVMIIPHKQNIYHEYTNLHSDQTWVLLFFVILLLLFLFTTSTTSHRVQWLCHFLMSLESKNLSYYNYTSYSAKQFTNKIPQETEIEESEENCKTVKLWNWSWNWWWNQNWYLTLWPPHQH